MSLDQVAQQLKLAPRQVKALEDQDFAHLPGRTFTRGFVRNYARLLNLDAGGLLARLPDAAEAPALEAPTLQSTGAMIAELPTAEMRAPSFGRWLIPLVLVGCVVAAAGYEWYRGGMVTNESAYAPALKSEPANQVSSAPSSATSVSVPNPLDPAARAEPPVTAASPPSETATAPVTSPGRASRTPARGRAPAPTSLGRAGDEFACAAGNASAPAAPDLAPPVAVAPAPLVLTYRGSSWTRIRDRNGNVLISRTVPSGSQQSLRGVPPFEVVIGNANMVTLVYRGEQVDLARFTSHNVARLRLS
jgi:cytoskeleton protein RodZ